MIKTQNLSFIYQQNMPTQRQALSNINIHIKKGSLTAIIGHTGSGKSTLIQLFNALIKPTSGKIFVDGVDIHSEGINLSDIRKKVGLVFQYPEYQLFEETVEADIAFGPKNLGLSESEISDRVSRSAHLVGLKEKYMKRSPFELSGGQKRRCAIAGVIAMQPSVIILDEPAAGLDPKGRHSILSMLKTLHETEPELTIIFVSHSMDDVAYIADDIIVMYDGTAIMQGGVNDIFSKADELIKIGLDVPQITTVFSRLRSKGFDLPNDVYTVKYGADYLISKLGGKTNG